jgi:hypothetical protein
MMHNALAEPALSVLLDTRLAIRGPEPFTTMMHNACLAKRLEAGVQL